MRFLWFVILLIPFTVATQETEVRQLQFLLNDLKNNFRESIDTSSITQAEDSNFTAKSTVNLRGSADNVVDYSRDGGQWAFYTAFISDSCSLKEAKRLCKYWRNLAHEAAPRYMETKKDGKQKTSSGHPFFGYDFELLENGYKYSIGISYAERPLNNGYSVMVLLGRQFR